MLESVFLPSTAAAAASSNEQQQSAKYNVPLMEKLLRILYSSCQYGESNHLL